MAHERLLRRPKAEDSLLGRRRHVQGSGGPHLLREPLLGPKRYGDKTSRENPWLRRRAPDPLRSWTTEPSSSWRRTSKSAPLPLPSEIAGCSRRTSSRRSARSYCTVIETQRLFSPVHGSNTLALLRFV